MCSKLQAHSIASSTTLKLLIVLGLGYMRVNAVFFFVYVVATSTNISDKTISLLTCEIIKVNKVYVSAGNYHSHLKIIVIVYALMQFTYIDQKIIYITLLKV